MSEPLLTRYLQPLLAGRRAECFSLIHQAVDGGRDPKRIIFDVLWPAMHQVDRLYRDDRINKAVENMACRINRTIADQIQSRLPAASPTGRRILITCADEPQEELGAQMVADLFQSEGWDVYFVGGGVPFDEMTTLVGQLRPSLLLIFGTQPASVPAVRQFVLHLREIGVCPTMNVMVSGGVFNRADGLWHEVGADVYAETAKEALTVAADLGPRQPGLARVGMVKQRQRKRKAAKEAVAVMHA